jgi:glycosyltransferase involved in cell wall biosynthesis
VSAQHGVEISEILVGINSSTDRTKEIVEEYSPIDARVRVIDSLKGKANAWNALNAAARCNLRIFQDGDTTTSNDSYRRLVDEFDDYDIIGASIKRDTRNKGIITKVINFPSKYVRPYPVLNGNLYLMDYRKISALLHRELGRIEMPSAVINDDEFLQMIVDKVRVSENVFVNLDAANGIHEEVIRYRRMKLGSRRLQIAYPSLYRRKIESVAMECTKMYQLFYLLKGATTAEKALFPPVMLMKFCVFRYIHSQANKNSSCATVQWK